MVNAQPPWSRKTVLSRCSSSCSRLAPRRGWTAPRKWSPPSRSSRSDWKGASPSLLSKPMSKHSLIDFVLCRYPLFSVPNPISLCSSIWVSSISVGVDIPISNQSSTWAADALWCTPRFKTGDNWTQKLSLSLLCVILVTCNNYLHLFIFMYIPISDICISVLTESMISPIYYLKKFTTELSWILRRIESYCMQWQR